LVAVLLPNRASSEMYPGQFLPCWKLPKVEAKTGFALNLVGAINSKYQHKLLKIRTYESQHLARSCF
jgi:hypothetical protein